MRRNLYLFSPLFLLSSCAELQPPLASDTDAHKADDNEVVPPSITIEGYLTGAERQEFEATVRPAANKFITDWHAQGLRFRHPPRLMVSPPPGIALATLYGPSFHHDLDALDAAVNNATTTAELAGLVEAFACRYPPLLIKAEQGLPAEAPPELIKAAVLKETQRLRAPDVSTEFYQDNGKFDATSGGRCSYILLGRSREPVVRPHSFLTPTIVTHELGHALEYALWDDRGWASGRSGISQRSHPYSEAIADLLSAVSHNDACHAPRRDAAGNVSCGRTMQGHTEPYTELVSQQADNYRAGQPLRDLVWQMQGLDPNLPAHLAAAIRTTVASLRDASHPVPWKLDDIYLTYYELDRELQAATDFATAFCQMPTGACATPLAFVGTYANMPTLADYQRHAPTLIATAGLSLPDGTTLTFSHQGARLTALHVTRHGVTHNYDQRVVPRRIAIGDQAWVEIRFVDALARTAVWTSRGELREE